MMATIRILKLLILLSFISCKSQKKISNYESIDIVGKFVNYNFKKANSVEQIILARDSTINYELQIPVLGKLNLKGKWFVVKDTLNLLVDIPLKKEAGSIEIIYGKEKKSKLISIKVNDDFGLLFGSTLFVNGQQYDVISENITITPKFIENIRVIYNNEIYLKYLKTYVDKDIIVLIKQDQNRGDIYDFIKTKWLIKGNKIIEIDSNQLVGQHFLIKDNEILIK